MAKMAMPREAFSLALCDLSRPLIMQGTLNVSPVEWANSGAKGHTTSHRSTVKLSPDRDVSSVTRTAISLEYASLRHSQHCPLGIYVVPSAETLLVWAAVFFVHQGISLQLMQPIHHIDEH
jgi:hypothetical protein